jgi:hypothetical protein
MKGNGGDTLLHKKNVLHDLYETIRGGGKYSVINSYFFNHIACNHLQRRHNIE